MAGIIPYNPFVFISH